MCTSAAADTYGVGANTYGFTETPGVGANTYGFSTTPSSSLISPSTGALALGAAGALTNALSANNTANNTINADDAQANVQATNALIAERAASSAITTGMATAGNAYQKGGITGASQQAALAANGVDVDSGTAANLQASTKYVTDQNVDTITANAARTAMGYTQQSVNDSNAYGTLKAAAATVNPSLSVASSLLTSATSVASNWYRMQTAGVS